MKVKLLKKLRRKADKLYSIYCDTRNKEFYVTKDVYMPNTFTSITVRNKKFYRVEFQGLIAHIDLLYNRLPTYEERLEDVKKRMRTAKRQYIEDRIRTMRKNKIKLKKITF